MTPSELLRTTRRQAGISQAELARRVGSTQAAVARLERRGANPTVDTLDRLLRAMDRKLDLKAPKHRSSVDETLIASNLRRTPGERLRNFQSAHDSLVELRQLARESGLGV